MSEAPTPSGSFWSSIRWPRTELAMVVAVVVTLVALRAIYYTDTFYDPALYHAFSLVVGLELGLAGWVSHRVFVAWIRWPSRYRVTRWFKTVMAFLLTDPQHRYRD